MIKIISLIKDSGFFRSPVIEFLLFLLQPENSNATPNRNQRRYDRFDNRLGGAVKIAFWIAITFLFWISFPNLCALMVQSFKG
ncbi:MAG: hypothetical protein Q8R88_06405 [Desulfoprunum sp.]|nr:hypothetical protein [Desulfoprunum sp.]